MAALKLRDPTIDRPPYEILLNDKKGKWGPPDSNGWSAILSLPYASPQIPVELKWAFGKNYVANPKNCNTAHKPVAKVTQMLRERWYSADEQPMKWFEIAQSFIVQFIVDDRAQNGDDCPFVGQDLHHLAGYTDEDVERWKRECNMIHDGETAATNDIEIIGGEFDLNDEIEEEGAEGAE